MILWATALAATIALGTRPHAHPDEALHLDAFRYFEQRLWPPDLDADGLLYDPYGHSKVYSLELSYVLFGQIGRILRGLLGLDSWTAYRLLNVALLPLAFVSLALTPEALVPGRNLALAILALPQVAYVFGYANSDAWSVTVSVALFALSARLAQDPLPWSVSRAALLGTLAGLLLAAKSNFLFALILPVALLGPKLRREGLPWRTLPAIVLPALLLAAPLKLLYPLTQRPSFEQAAWRMVAKRTHPGFDRHNPSNPTVRIAGKGVTLREALVERGFLVRSAQSLWGVYGHMKVFNPPWVYVAAGILGLLNFGLTVRTTARCWRALPPARRLLLAVAPAVLLANLGLSFYMSFFWSFQPQGRYLFPSLLAVGLTLAGTTDLEGPGTLRLRAVSLVASLALGAWSLLALALPRL